MATKITESRILTIYNFSVSIAKIAFGKFDAFLASKTRFESNMCKLMCTDILLTLQIFFVGKIFSEFLRKSWLVSTKMHWATF